MSDAELRCLTGALSTPGHNGAAFVPFHRSLLLGAVGVLRFLLHVTAQGFVHHEPGA